MKQIIAWLGLMAVVLLAAGARGEDQNADHVTKVYTTTHEEHVVVDRTTTVHEVTTVHVVKPSYKCAIFVENHTDKVNDGKIAAFQDLLTGYATDKGFSIISREDALNAVSAMGGPNAGNAAAPGANLDAILSNNTSALRLAQNLHADYVLVCTITSYDTNRQTYRDPAQDVDLTSVTYKLRTTYRLLDIVDGGSHVAGVAVATITDRVDPRTGTMDRSDVVDDLLDADAMDMADMLGHDAHAGKVPETAVAPAAVKFEVHATVANLTIPVVVRRDDGRYEVTASRYHPEVLNAMVEVDGIAMGPTDQPLKVKPGLHKVVIRRDLFHDWEGTVNIYDGFKLDAAMKLTPEGLAEYAGLAKLFEHLMVHSVLTDAEAKDLEGKAAELSHSAIRVDIGQGAAGEVDLHDRATDTDIRAATTRP